MIKIKPNNLSIFRKTCNEVMERAKQAVPWFGIEQVRGQNFYPKNILKTVFKKYICLI